MHLPQSAIACHAVGFAAITPGAAWAEVSVDGAGGATALTRLDDSSLTAADLAYAVLVIVTNNDSAETVYATCTDPGAGAAALGIPIAPGTAQPLTFYGASTAPRCWVYGAAAAPAVTVLMSMAAAGSV